MAEASLRFVDGLVRLQQPTSSPVEYAVPEEALSELLRGHVSHYRGGMTGSTLTPYRAGRVSLPAPVKALTPLESLLTTRGREFLAGEGERMRLGADPLDPMLGQGADQIYVDPKLVSNRRRYVRFLRDLERRGLLTYGTWVHERV